MSPYNICRTFLEHYILEAGRKGEGRQTKEQKMKKEGEVLLHSDRQDLVHFVASNDNRQWKNACV